MINSLLPAGISRQNRGQTRRPSLFHEKQPEEPSPGEAIKMTTENHKKVVKEFYEEVFQKHNLNAVDRFMHDDYIQHNPDTAQGKKGFVDFHKRFFAAVPDFFAAINRMVAEGDLVFVFNTITGTHTGEGFLGYPPTGNKVQFDVVDMFRLRDGKLCEHWDVADTRALFSQVGAITERSRPN
jgi:steroid delta-isomerase-like uncharacterized protein